MPDLTFFVWADTHFGYEQRFGDDDLRASTIQQTIDPESGRVLYVFHITDTRLTGVPWRRDLQEWEQGRGWADPHAATQRLILDRSR